MGNSTKDNLPLVVVSWDDAWQSETPATLAHFVHKPERITTIGWLMKDDEEGVQLANEYYDDTFRGRTFIPRAMVKDVVEYKLTKTKKKAPKASPESSLTEQSS